MAKFLSRRALAQAIAQHIKEHGPRAWGLVRSQFPHLSDSTFWRTRTEVMSRLSTVVAADEHAPTTIFVEVDRPYKAFEFEQSPDIDCAEEITRLFHAARIAEQLALGQDPRTYRAGAFADAQRIRAQALKAADDYLENVNNWRRMEDFNEIMLEEIGKEAREVQICIIERLALAGHITKIPFVQPDMEWRAAVSEAVDGTVAGILRARRSNSQSASTQVMAETSHPALASEQRNMCSRFGLVQKYFEAETFLYDRGLATAAADVCAQKRFFSMAELYGLSRIEWRPGIRLSLDWLFSDEGDAFYPTDASTEEQRRTAWDLCHAIAKLRP